MRDPGLAKLRVGSALGMGLALGILYFDMGLDDVGMNDRITLLLFALMFLSVVNAIPVVLQVLPELAIVKKEVRNNWYAAHSFIPAKLIIETPLLLIPPCLFVAVSGTMTGMVDDGERFIYMYIAVLLVVCCAHAWALFIAGIAPSVDIAFLAAPGSILPMAVLSGFFKNQSDMTWVFRWFTYIDFLNYGWQAMATAGLRGLNFTEAAIPLTGEEVITGRLGLHSASVSNYWTNVAILICFMGFFRGLAIVIVSKKLTS